MEEYRFKVIQKNILQKKSKFNFKYDIEVLLAKCSKLYIRLELTRHEKDSRFFLNSLLLSHNEMLDYLDNTNKGILRGYFEFSEEENSKAWSMLRLVLNGEYIPNDFGRRWSDFKAQFVDWYNKSLKLKAESKFNLMKEQDIE